MKKILRLTVLLLLAVWVNAAYADTYTYEFATKVFTENGEQNLGGINWTLQTDAKYFGYNTDKGQQIGSGSEPATYVNLSTDGISGTVSSIKVETSGAKGIDANLTITVGGKSFGDTYKLTNVNTEHNFTGNAAGQIVLKYENKAKAIYIKKITIEYDKQEGDDPEEEEEEEENEEDPIETAQTFVFNTEEGLTELGISVPESGSWTNITNDIKSKGITLSNTKNITEARLYNNDGSYTFRIYDGGTMTLKTDNETPITKIIIDFDKVGSITSADGALEINDKVGTWTGNAKSVTFNIVSKCHFNTINVTANENAPKPLQEVKGLKELKSVEDDTDVYLYIPDADDVRMLFADSDNNAFLRDKNGDRAYFKGIKTTPAMKYNQHLAGYVYGKKTSVGEMIVLEAINKTNSEKLLIADPVTEDDVMPASVTDNMYGNHIADWVVIKEHQVKNGKVIVNGKEITINNAYNLNADKYYQTPYDNAVIDMSAIVFATASDASELRPIYNKVEKTNIHNVSENEFVPIVYVIGEDIDFVLPNENITNTAVRLKRELSDESWNTITLPFGIENVEGALRSYKSVEENVMTFVEAKNIEPGMPYLYKPAKKLENTVYKGVTLSNVLAKDVEHDGFHFVGTYKPYVMKNDKTERFMGEGEKLYSPTSEEQSKVAGMGAYFVVPATADEVMVSFSDIPTGIGSIMPGTNECLDNAQVYNLGGQFVGHAVTQLPKGIYIVNGKKLVVR